MRPLPPSIVASSLLLLVPLAACSGDDHDDNGSGSPGSTQGTLVLDATDAPFAYDVVTTARIGIDRISVNTDAAATDSGFVVLYEGAPKLVDFLSLQNGALTELVDAHVDAGTYRQVRLHVTSAEVTLSNGHAFTTGAGTLALATQPAEGFAFAIDPGVDVTNGSSHTLLLDFDMAHSFRFAPAGDVLAATSATFGPVVHVADPDTSGEIRGLVTQDAGGTPFPVGAATVYVLPQGQTDVGLALATTGTATTGHYALLGLAPGTYDVFVVHGEQDALVPGQVVTAGTSTVVDATIQ